MGHRRIFASAVAVLAIAGGLVIGAPAGGRTTAGVDDDVRINQIQVIGSHNSYKRMVSPAEEELRRSFLSDGANLMQYQQLYQSNMKVAQVANTLFDAALQMLG